MLYTHLLYLALSPYHNQMIKLLITEYFLDMIKSSTPGEIIAILPLTAWHYERSSF